MAKGLRATTRKRNRAKLRATIYGPAHDARTERLSAKLMEIAAKPRPVQEKAMEIDDTEAVTVEKSRGKGQERDVDGGPGADHTAISQSKSRRPSRIEKKIARRKAKSSIVFAPNARQRKRMKGKGKK